MTVQLYHVQYKGVAFDPARPLPAASEDIAYAKNINGAGEYLIPVEGRWVETDRATALARNERASYSVRRSNGMPWQYGIGSLEEARKVARDAVERGLSDLEIVNEVTGKVVEYA